MSEEEGAVSASKAKMVLEADRMHRMTLCSEEIAAVLKRHGCQLVAVPMLSPDGRVVARVQVVGEG